MGGCPGTKSGSRSRLTNPHDRDRGTVSSRPLPILGYELGKMTDSYQEINESMGNHWLDNVS